MYEKKYSLNLSIVINSFRRQKHLHWQARILIKNLGSLCTTGSLIMLTYGTYIFRLWMQCCAVDHFHDVAHQFSCWCALSMLCCWSSNNTGICSDMFKAKMKSKDYVSRQRSRENCKLESFRTVRTPLLPFFFLFNLTTSLLSLKPAALNTIFLAFCIGICIR